MGQDKAMLPLAGRSLLGRAVDTLRAVPALRDEAGRVTVTVVGERTELEGADRAIADRHPGCGPLGGMEAALADLGVTAEGEWAFFLPVDMPFLPAGLIEELLEEWIEAGGRGSAACYMAVDGTPQPLVSLLHVTLHPFIAQALTAGLYKVTQVLQSATEILASQYADGLGCRAMGVHRTPIIAARQIFLVAAWAPSEVEERYRRLWFSNLNTKEDFLEAETFLSSEG
jgi:molybdopterin-guanine dinucleotide biosynthesis protein A